VVGEISNATEPIIAVDEISSVQRIAGSTTLITMRSKRQDGSNNTFETKLAVYEIERLIQDAQK
jgi:hypothetical protein